MQKILISKFDKERISVTHNQLGKKARIMTESTEI